MTNFNKLSNLIVADSVNKEIEDLKQQLEAAKNYGERMRKEVVRLQSITELESGFYVVSDEGEWTSVEDYKAEKFAESVASEIGAATIIEIKKRIVM
jgi:hypothetical protein